MRNADNVVVLVFRRRCFSSANIQGVCRSSLAYGTLLAKSAFTLYSRSTTAMLTL
jgi:hypothetical protein